MTLLRKSRNLNCVDCNVPTKGTGRAKGPRCKSCAPKYANRSLALSPSLSAVHQWVRAKYGGASKQKCQKCGSSNTVDWANRDGRYLRDRRNWMLLCRSCHKKYDNKLAGITPSSGSSHVEKNGNFYHVRFSRKGFHRTCYGGYRTLKEAKRRVKEIIELFRKRDLVQEELNKIDKALLADGVDLTKPL